MNVTCDQCGKKYVISDEKIGGKTVFKVRCKQCSNLISVNVTASMPSPAPQVAPVGPPPPAQWFAMLGGQQQGPFDLAQLTQRAAVGEVTSRTHVWRAGMAAWSRIQDVPEVAAAIPTPPAGADAPPAASMTPTPQSLPHSAKGPLDGLFGDEAVTLTPTPTPAQAPVDPFAALGATDGDAPMGETTRSFLIASGANKRNPPWKIALFALAFIGGPVLLVYLLNTFEIVKLPTVTRTNEKGEEVQESFFSAGGAEGLKDLLTGDGAKKKAERLAAEEAAKKKAAQTPKKNSGGGNTEPEVVTPKAQDPSLAAFYGDTGLKTAGPKVRKNGDDNGSTTAVNSSGLSQEAVGKVVADKQKAFQTCIDNALRRNPNLAVGNITVVLTVGPSGAVKAAGIDPKKHEITDWGQCMMSTGKRIVFPGSDAETQLELPFKVGVAVAP